MAMTVQNRQKRQRRHERTDAIINCSDDDEGDKVTVTFSISRELRTPSASTSASTSTDTSTDASASAFCWSKPPEWMICQLASFLDIYHLARVLPLVSSEWNSGLTRHEDVLYRDALRHNIQWHCQTNHDNNTTDSTISGTTSSNNFSNNNNNNNEESNSTSRFREITKQIQADHPTTVRKEVRLVGYNTCTTNSRSVVEVISWKAIAKLYRTHSIPVTIRNMMGDPVTLSSIRYYKDTVRHLKEEFWNRVRLCPWDDRRIQFQLVLPGSRFGAIPEDADTRIFEYNRNNSSSSSSSTRPANSVVDDIDDDDEDEWDEDDDDDPQHQNDANSTRQGTTAGLQFLTRWSFRGRASFRR